MTQAVWVRVLPKAGRAWMLGLGLCLFLGAPAVIAPAAAAGKPPAAKTASAKTASAARRKPAAKRAPARTQKKAVRARKAQAKRPAAPSRLSFAQKAGLHATPDPLGLKAGVALVLDPDSDEVLLSKNETAVLPIASLTKLMTGLLISEAELPLDEIITITDADVDRLKGSRSRLPVGTRLSRGELLHLALMSSENRAAHALGRTYPGGLAAFVSAMNARAQLLGMSETRYVEPTGLSSDNRSSARDLATLVVKAARDPLLRRFSTSPGHEVALGRQVLQYNNTNRLVREPGWDIGLQKTGFISEAGQCLVMQTRVAERELIMVFLAADSRTSRLQDARRVRDWLQEPVPAASTLAAAL